MASRAECRINTLSAEKPLSRMDPIESWVDARELRRMADDLLGSPAAKVEASGAEEAGFNSGFVGYGSEASLPSASPVPEQAAGKGESSARHALAAARAFAQRGGMLDPPADSQGEHSEGPTGTAQLTEVTPVSSAGVPPRPAMKSSLFERLVPFGAWLRGPLGARAYFLLDREGGVLVDEVQSSKLHEVARNLAQASYTANRLTGTVATANLHIKIVPGTVLEVVPVSTRQGPLILGIIAPDPLDSRRVEAAAHALQQVVDSPSGS
mgnify:CR=1 FL=1